MSVHRLGLPSRVEMYTSVLLFPMKWLHALPALSLFLLICGCGPQIPGSDSRSESLAEARKGFQTRLLRHERESGPAPEPPQQLFRLVRYTSPAGQLAAYVSPPPGDGKRHPIVLWITGGFSNSIDEVSWTRFPPNNDQSASAFREAGLLMMYPSFRGGNDNPGSKEDLFGEVDDVLAAVSYVSQLDYADPDRIYLGGHSTGGTLALLAAECGNRFRAVFSFGPVGDVRGYGDDTIPFDSSIPKESLLRAPGRWLKSIQNPTYVFEGTDGRTNIKSLGIMSKSEHPEGVHFHPVAKADHFSTLAPVTHLIAQKILADTGPSVNIAFTDEELAKAVASYPGSAKAKHN